MKQRVEQFTVGDLARHAGVSVRTLHHYDSVGLLKPLRVAENGYRIYSWDDAMRLQEIMFYREVGLTLKEIQAILDAPVNALDRLERHRERLQSRAERMTEMLKTLDSTIAHLKGSRDMNIDELYKPFSPEKQAEYENWLVREHGPDMASAIATAKGAISEIPDGMEGALGRLRAIESRLVEEYQAGTAFASDILHESLEDQRALMAEFWGRECDANGIEGLAQMYQSHPDFVARYEALATGFCEWLVNAMQAHAERLRSKA